MITNVIDLSHAKADLELKTHCTFLFVRRAIIFRHELGILTVPFFGPADRNVNTASARAPGKNRFAGRFIFFLVSKH